MSSFEVEGMKQDAVVPCIISSDIDGSTEFVYLTNMPQVQSVVDKLFIDFFRLDKQHLLTVLFEMNPLDECCDQRVIVNSQPLQIIYDAVSFRFRMQRNRRQSEQKKGLLKMIYIIICKVNETKTFAQTYIT